MSMLAERKRKQKWTLNPGRRALWNSDESSGVKFGKELMEKMGWKAGQGLGISEQGIKEPLKVSFKDDSKGIGYKDKDDEWIQQQQDFNQFLNELSSVNNQDEDQPKTSKVISLEEKSRQSKARVHYHKFTRGKDLSGYSEKDLECILGKYKNEPEKVPDVEVKCDEEDKEEKIGGLTIVNAGSMVDYFAKKMKELKMKSKITLLENNSGLNNLQNEMSTVENGTSVDDGNDGEECPRETVDGSLEVSNEKEDHGERKKKKKKSKEKENFCDLSLTENCGIGDDENICEKVKKKKKSKKDCDSTNLVEYCTAAENEDNCKKVKKKKSKEEKENTNDLSVTDNCKIGDENMSDKMKKKKKSEQEFNDNNLVENLTPVEEGENSEKVHRKKKKSKMKLSEDNVTSALEKVQIKKEKNISSEVKECSPQGREVAGGTEVDKSEFNGEVMNLKKVKKMKRDEGVENFVDEDGEKKRKKKKEKHGGSIETSLGVNEDNIAEKSLNMEVPVDDDLDICTGKSKKKRKIESANEAYEEEGNRTVTTEVEPEESVQKKKRRKDKKEKVREGVSVDATQSDHEDGVSLKKKKKKKRDSENEPEDEPEQKKRKKDRRKENSCEEKESAVIIECEDKKSKKRKSSEETTEAQDEMSTNEKMKEDSFSSSIPVVYKTEFLRKAKQTKEYMLKIFQKPNFKRFKGSNIESVLGYALPKQAQLEVTT